jgi:preprotein translocase subunit YajC
MRYRGLMTVCVLTCGLGLAMAASAMAQDTRPAPAPVEPKLVPVPGSEKAPAEPTLVPVPTGKQPPAAVPGLGAPAPAKQPVDANSVGGSKDKQPPSGMENYLLPVLLGGVVLMWIWMGRGRRKQEAKRKEMLSNLKKGDKIVSIGGIIGTVIEAKPEEITVKVDETNNVRMKFARWAIRGVGEDARTTSPDDDKK